MPRGQYGNTVNRRKPVLRAAPPPTTMNEGLPLNYDAKTMTSCMISTTLGFLSGPIINDCEAQGMYIPRGEFLIVLVREGNSH